jgi:dihydroorotate dehydrogenase electron transfer subunit
MNEGNPTCTPSPGFSQVRATVVLNRQLARATFLIRLQAPALARAIRPGQFMMLRLPAGNDPLLGRPFALFDTQDDTVEVVYLVVGKVTNLLAQLRPGDGVEAWGPLGNGFADVVGVNHIGLVAGGIGQTPFLAAIRHYLGSRSYGRRPARRQCQRVSLYYGVRSAEYAAGVEDFRAAGAEVHLTTDDGTLGFRGLVTQLLDQQLSVDPPQHLIGCGPEPMLRALALLAHSKGLPCHVSLETPMACGVGICFSCVTRVSTESGWDFRRVCCEGPVFDCRALHDFGRPVSD